MMTNQPARAERIQWGEVQGVFDNVVEPHKGDFEDLERWARGAVWPPPAMTSKGKQAAIVAGTFRVGLHPDETKRQRYQGEARWRTKALAERVFLLLLDIDVKNPANGDLTREEVLAAFPGYRCIDWSTHSHGVPGVGLRMRLVLVWRRPLCAETEHPAAYAWALAHLINQGIDVHHIDAGCINPDRVMHLLRSVSPKSVVAPWIEVCDEGVDLDPDALPGGWTVARVSNALALIDEHGVRSVEGLKKPQARLHALARVLSGEVTTDQIEDAIAKRRANSEAQQEERRRTQALRRRAIRSRGAWEASAHAALQAYWEARAREQLDKCIANIESAADRHAALLSAGRTMGGEVTAEYEDADGNWHPVGGITRDEVIEALDGAAHTKYGAEYPKKNVPASILSAVTHGEGQPWHHEYRYVPRAVKGAHRSSKPRLETEAEAPPVEARDDSCGLNNSPRNEDHTDSLATIDPSLPADLEPQLGFGLEDDPLGEEAVAGYFSPFPHSTGPHHPSDAPATPPKGPLDAPPIRPDQTRDTKDEGAEDLLAYLDPRLVGQPLGEAAAQVEQIAQAAFGEEGGTHAVLAPCGVGKTHIIKALLTPIAIEQRQARLAWVEEYEDRKEKAPPAPWPPVVALPTRDGADELADEWNAEGKTLGINVQRLPSRSPDTCVRFHAVVAAQDIDPDGAADPDEGKNRPGGTRICQDCDLHPFNNGRRWGCPWGQDFRRFAHEVDRGEVDVVVATHAAWKQTSARLSERRRPNIVVCDESTEQTTIRAVSFTPEQLAAVATFGGINVDPVVWSRFVKAVRSTLRPGQGLKHRAKVIKPDELARLCPPGTVEAGDSAVYASVVGLLMNKTTEEDVRRVLEHNMPVTPGDIDMLVDAHDGWWRGCRAQDGELHVERGDTWPDNARGTHTTLHLDATSTPTAARALWGHDCVVHEVAARMPDHVSIMHVEDHTLGSLGHVDDNEPRGRTRAVWAGAHIGLDAPDTLHLTLKKRVQEGTWTHDVLKDAIDNGRVTHINGTLARGSNRWSHVRRVIMDPYHPPRAAVRSRADTLARMAGVDLTSSDVVPDEYVEAAMVMLKRAPVEQAAQRARLYRAHIDRPVELWCLGFEPTDHGLPPADVVVPPAVLAARGGYINHEAVPLIAAGIALYAEGRPLPWSRSKKSGVSIEDAATLALRVGGWLGEEGHLGQKVDEPLLVEGGIWGTKQRGTLQRDAVGWLRKLRENAALRRRGREDDPLLVVNAALEDAGLVLVSRSTGAVLETRRPTLLGQAADHVATLAAEGVTSVREICRIVESAGGAWAGWVPVLKPDEDAASDAFPTEDSNLYSSGIINTYRLSTAFEDSGAPDEETAPAAPQHTPLRGVEAATTICKALLQGEDVHTPLQPRSHMFASELLGAGYDLWGQGLTPALSRDLEQIAQHARHGDEIACHTLVMKLVDRARASAWCALDTYTPAHTAHIPPNEVILRSTAAHPPHNERLKEQHA